MASHRDLTTIIDELSEIFTSNSGKILYDQQTQYLVSDLLIDLAEKSGTFEKNIKNEFKNLNPEFSTLIDLDSIPSRVFTVLIENNIYACLKSLAITNKCAHAFDGDITSAKNALKELYQDIYYEELNSRTFSFMHDIDLALPDNFEANPLKIYQLPELSASRFKSIRSILDKQNPKKGEKIGILRDLKINIQGLSDAKIDELFSMFQDNKKYLDYLFLRQLYKQGQHLVILQSKVFALKNEFTSMIGQLLVKNNNFSKLTYELVKTEHATTGFEYMLVIDDPELQYYIEVHMPNFIAFNLMHHGLKFSEERKTTKLGASAVYKRDPDEILNILMFQQTNEFSAAGKQRAKVITRDYVLDGDGGKNTDPSNESNSDLPTQTVSTTSIQTDFPETYSFDVDQISTELTHFEEFLKYTSEFQESLSFNMSYMSNESFSYKSTQKIVDANYHKIFTDMNENAKIEFISFSLGKLEGGDIFDRCLIRAIMQQRTQDIDLIGKLLISQKALKDKTIKYVNKQLTQSYKKYSQEDITILISDYLNKYMTRGFKEKRKNGNKR